MQPFLRKCGIMVYILIVSLFRFQEAQRTWNNNLCPLQKRPISFHRNAISRTMKIIHQIKVLTNPVLTIGCYRAQFQLNYFCI